MITVTCRDSLKTQKTSLRTTQLKAKQTIPDQTHLPARKGWKWAYGNERMVKEKRWDEIRNWNNSFKPSKTNINDIILEGEGSGGEAAGFVILL
jgi:hypothetical protein